MKCRLFPAFLALVGVALVALSGPAATVPARAQAAGVCVNPGGTSGCMSSIQAAVNAAAPGATVTVAAGTYTEMVTISQPLRLIGAGMESTTINANGLDNGVHIAADHVWLQGFTITGARLDGVLVNGNYDTIIDTSITGNATLVIPPPPGSPPVPATWNGLNLQNSSYALVADNNVSRNAGRGIRTEGSAIYNYPDQGINQVIQGRSDHNLIIGNTVDSNGAACGIVLSTDSSDNLVEGNTSTNNPAGIIVAVLP
ncbi:MAG TPA: right-handed parallel beta-helix repeat-containing protein, partial [Dehalococcoidia bacterium]|nr:right-handed parallel beta-helix repeat-containing protein [Dehalococcoidia bacterium]